MLAVLLHRVANATQHLNGLSALLAVDPGALAARGDDLAETSDRVDDAGWLLALIASASGSRLLLARREREGLVPLVECVRECLRRAGRDLAAPAENLPDLAPDVGEGWQLPWAIGTLLHEAARSLPARTALAWSFRRTPGRPGRPGTVALACAPAADFDPRELVAWLARELPAARLALAGGELALEVPAAWLPENARTA
jgi:hypothetical protein